MLWDEMQMFHILLTNVKLRLVSKETKGKCVYDQSAIARCLHGSDVCVMKRTMWRMCTLMKQSEDTSKCWTCCVEFFVTAQIVFFNNGECQYMAAWAIDLLCCAQNLTTKTALIWKLVGTRGAWIFLLNTYMLEQPVIMTIFWAAYI